MAEPARSVPRLQSRTVYRGRAVAVRVDTISKKAGPDSTREVVEHSDSVAVVVFDENRNFILERQMRHAAGKELLEIPAGGIDPGESPEECVRRELQEEIGFLPGQVRRIGGFFAAPGFCTEYLHLFLAWELKPSRLRASDTDEITLVRVPVSEAAALITSGRIKDAKSIAGLLTALTFYRREIGA